MIAGISSLSVSNVWYKVADTNPLGDPHNPTSGAVALAFTTGDDPTVDDWHTATWESNTISDDEGSWYLARVEVGPGTDIPLAKDIYVLWIKLGNSDPVVLRGRTLHVY